MLFVQPLDGRVGVEVHKVTSLALAPIYKLLRSLWMGEGVGVGQLCAGCKNADT